MERVSHSRTIYDGKAVKLVRHDVTLPSGRRTMREVIEHPGSVAIVPLLGEKVVMVRQFRVPAGGSILEIPAGTLEPGEEPIECAKRELLEETGYWAEVMEPIFKAYPTPGYSSELMHFFLAQSLVRKAPSPQMDEVLEVIIYSIEELRLMMDRGEIRDLKTLCALKHLMATR